MTTLWRISRHRDLTGAGGLRASGRWHERGRPIVYLAESPAGALLESCVHTSANNVPLSYVLLEVRVEDDLPMVDLDVSKLSRNWPEQLEATRQVGSGWLRSLRSALARVPSALVPATFNVLLNPLHPDAKNIRMVKEFEYPFDPRIKK